MKLFIFIFIFCLSCYTLSFGQVRVLPGRFSPVNFTGTNHDLLKLDLAGMWEFNQNPENGISRDTSASTKWQPIQVPGEWAMQGYRVEKNHWAAYRRQFQLPAEWKGRKIKLQCHAVYSEAEIYVNGYPAGSHLGGFTPFEFDITSFVGRRQKSWIVIRVKNEGVADSLASGSKYAVHALGGITRKIDLVALPVLNISQLQVSTKFDSLYRNAVLTVTTGLSNEQVNSAGKIQLVFDLYKPGSGDHIFSKKIVLNETLSPGSGILKDVDFPVEKPLKWDPEHPNLYNLKVTLIGGDSVLESVQRRIGFREIAVKGNRVYVNNMPVKLRGVCRHETTPHRGRSLTGTQWEKDVEIFREGNVNYIRTSHYPPAEEFIEACDSLGMFVEVEAPFCWAERTKVPDSLYEPALIRQTLDMVNFYRSDPSVLMWSMGNESLMYKDYFKKTAELVKQLDPTRPRNFSQYTPEGDDGELEISNHHYPGPSGPEKYANSKRPVVFDEYCHLNAYNRSELVTDPGLRDAWGTGFNAMWEKMQATPSILGGALWAGIDDSFFLPDGHTVGYGAWGVIDGWRRPKPEYWHMKKAYSPVKIQVTGNWDQGGLFLQIENRLLFSNLNECLLKWTLGKRSGKIEADIQPGSRSAVILKLKQRPTENETLVISVYDPRGVWIDQYEFKNLVPKVTILNDRILKTVAAWKYADNGNIMLAHTAKFDIQISKIEGSIIIRKNGKQLLLGGAQLMVLPLNSKVTNMQMTGSDSEPSPFTALCHDRIIRKVELVRNRHEYSVCIWDEYAEAEGKTCYLFYSDGQMNISYQYEIKKEINPRQWGLVFTLPSYLNQLEWKRRGLWNWYPQDHIGRLEGSALLITSDSVCGIAGPNQKPSHPWLQDTNLLGSNDFRSTKMNIEEASLSGGGSVIQVKSNGEQHIRTWSEGAVIRMLIAGYSNMGGEPFFNAHAIKMERPLKPGDMIQDTIKIHIQ